MKKEFKEGCENIGGSLKEEDGRLVCEKGFFSKTKVKLFPKGRLDIEGDKTDIVVEDLRRISTLEDVVNFHVDGKGWFRVNENGEIMGSIR